MSANENAEAVLIVIKRIAKWAAIAMALLIAAGFLIWGGTWTYEYFTFELPKSKVEIVVAYKNDDRCSADYPVFVGVVNKSDKTIQRYSFRFVATHPGRSTNLAKEWESYSDDKIIEPGQGWGNCWRIRKDSEYGKTEWLTEDGLDVSVTGFYPRFSGLIRFQSHPITRPHARERNTT